MRISDWSSDVCCSDLGEQRPGPHPARPGGVDLAFDERGDGEGERHGEADIAGIKHRRVEGEAGILQQRVEVFAVERCRELAQEGVGGQQREGDEADTDPRLRSEEHTSDIQSLMRISYADYWLKKQQQATQQ